MVNDSRIPGGIPFDPSLYWAASQSYFFWLDRDIYSEIRTNPIYRYPVNNDNSSGDGNKDRSSQGDSPLNQISSHEKEGCQDKKYYDGCTGLKWLNGTLFQACCDTHDHCYQPPSDSGRTKCTMFTWLFFFWDWRCTECNVEVIKCFATLGKVNDNHNCNADDHKPDDDDSE